MAQPAGKHAFSEKARPKRTECRNKTEKRNQDLRQFPSILLHATGCFYGDTLAFHVPFVSNVANGEEQIRRFFHFKLKMILCDMSHSVVVTNVGCNLLLSN